MMGMQRCIFGLKSYPFIFFSSLLKGDKNERAERQIHHSLALWRMVVQGPAPNSGWDLYILDVLPRSGASISSLDKHDCVYFLWNWGYSVSIPRILVIFKPLTWANALRAVLRWGFGLPGHIIPDF